MKTVEGNKAKKRDRRGREMDVLGRTGDKMGMEREGSLCLGERMTKRGRKL